MECYFNAIFANSAQVSVLNWQNSRIDDIRDEDWRYLTMTEEVIIRRKKTPQYGVFGALANRAEIRGLEYWMLACLSGPA
jgi:hypothetical protein